MNIGKNRYFNANGLPSQDDDYFGLNTSGIIDFNAPSHKWASNIYDLMTKLTWFTSEVNTADEKKNFNNLTPNEQEIYKMVFSQLSANDSMQTKYLIDFAAKTNNGLIKGLLARQSSEELLHSQSYAVLLDNAGNSKEVMEYYKRNKDLEEKNEAIAEMFSKYINSEKVDDMLLAAVASANLEGIFFLTGFGFIHLLGDKVPGARDMIKFISRDEITTHLPIFVNIFKTILRENKISHQVLEKVTEMIDDAVNIELKFALKLINENPLLGASEDLVRTTVHNFANERLKLLGLTPIYEHKDMTHMQRLVIEGIEKINDVKTNFFEGNNVNYSKGSIDTYGFKPKKPENLL